jgi:hypothetical protein
MGGLEPRLVTTVVSKDARAHWTREGGLNLESLESSPVGNLACYHARVDSPMGELSRFRPSFGVTQHHSFSPPALLVEQKREDPMRDTLGKVSPE